MTLDQLKVGQSATVSAITSTGTMAQRIMQLGLLEGSDVAIKRKAISGDPIEISVLGYALSLRKNEASMVEVDNIK